MSDAKTTWNYRVRKRIITGNHDDWESYDIIETYYEDDKVVMWAEPSPAQGDCLDDLRADLQLMAAALDWPVLDDAELPRARGGLHV